MGFGSLFFNRDYLHSFRIIAWISNYCHIKQWYIITHPSPNFDGRVKLRSHMHGAVAERRRADFDIPAPPLHVCSHIRGADAGGSAFSWGQRWFGARGFEADAENWVLDPILAERILLPPCLRSATAYVWTHVMICVEANFPPASAPPMCEHTFKA